MHRTFMETTGQRPDADSCATIILTDTPSTAFAKS
jgi:hypothetical protein